MDFINTQKKDGFFYLTEEQLDTSSAYISARKKENRILTDDEVRILPYLKRYEWPLREKSTERFTAYISNKNKNLNILDIGCGNGWFSNKIANVSNKNQVLGLDVNRNELEQAARVFQKNNLQFVYADIFKMSKTFKTQFDIITLNGSVQYFSNFDHLLNTLLSFLKPKGEIHIIDSPFYPTHKIADAKQRTLIYYTNLGVPEMAENYHHHDKCKVVKFEMLYQYKLNIINRLRGKKDSPFSWLRYIKH